MSVELETWRELFGHRRKERERERERERDLRGYMCQDGAGVEE